MPAFRALIPAMRPAQTGGSSIECATENQAMTAASQWSNMGHNAKAHLPSCLLNCVFRGVRPRIVMTIRNPYAFWRSLFTYAWIGVHAEVVIDHGYYRRGLGEEVAARTGALGSAMHPLRSLWEVRARTFGDFLRLANASGVYHSQSQYIKNSCPDPCRIDHVLHTETLVTDWYALLQHLELPLVQLPHTNPTKTDGRAGPPPRTVFTQDVLDVIHRVDARMFGAEFGYTRRAAGFELRPELTR